MPSGLSSAHVIDRQGTVVASSDARATDNLAGAEQLPLPQGGALVICRANEEAWRLFARAFAHEVRSPLNAMVLYLELASNHRAEPAPDRPKPSLEYLLGRVQDQVKRIDDLLAMFGQVWAPKSDEPTDVAALARSLVPFARHEAFRHSLSLETDLCPNARVRADSGLVAEALVELFGAAIKARLSNLVFSVHEDDDEAVVSLTGAPGTFPTEAAERAFSRAGARVEAGPQGVRAAFHSA